MPARCKQTRLNAMLHLCCHLPAPRYTGRFCSRPSCGQVSRNWLEIEGYGDGLGMRDLRQEGKPRQFDRNAGKAKYLGGVGTKITGITRREFKPNLQTVRATLPNGSHKTLRVCTQCIRSGSVRRTQKQAPFQLPRSPASNLPPRSLPPPRPLRKRPLPSACDHGSSGEDQAHEEVVHVAESRRG